MSPSASWLQSDSPSGNYSVHSSIGIGNWLLLLLDFSFSYTHFIFCKFFFFHSVCMYASICTYVHKCRILWLVVLFIIYFFLCTLLNFSLLPSFSCCHLTSDFLDTHTHTYNQIHTIAKIPVIFTFNTDTDIQISQTCVNMFNRSTCKYCRATFRT